MPDALFAEARLARLYDVLEGERPDLEAYDALATELAAHSVLDVGCGTGVLALMLAGRGLEVTGLDPAAASLDVARAKPGAEAVTWVHGTTADLAPLDVDLAVMTGNVAQVFTGDDDWASTLADLRTAIRPGGHLVLETRRPEAQAWRGWNRDATRRVGDEVETWCDLVAVEPPLVSFRWTYVLAADGTVLTSDSTLRFRTRDEIERSLATAGFEVVEVREAPDRPGLELVFLARVPLAGHGDPLVGRAGRGASVSRPPGPDESDPGRDPRSAPGITQT